MTILKWAGNKTAIMPELIKHLPAGQRLVEPFAGSCAVMMATDYPHYLVADINPDLIKLYREIATNASDFIERSKHLFKGFNSEDGYYDSRDSFNQDKDPEWQAPLFLFLNRHCYRGLCRYNKKGEFNAPYGHYKKPYFPENEIRAFAEKATPHKRERLFFGALQLADTLRKQQYRSGDKRQGGGNEFANSSSGSRMADTDNARLQGRGGVLECANQQPSRASGLASGVDYACALGRSEGRHRNNGRHEWEQPSAAGKNGWADTFESFWADADWLGCRDGKFRPVEAGAFPLADGIPARVGRLRGYGNAIVPQLAAEFVGAFLDSCEAVR